MSKTKVVVKRSTSGRLRASIDDRALKFVGDVAERELDPGSHRLTWTVEGKGRSYSVKVTKPSSIKAGGSSDKTTKEITFGASPFKVAKP